MKTDWSFTWRVTVLFSAYCLLIIVLCRFLPVRDAAFILGMLALLFGLSTIMLWLQRNQKQ